MESLGRFFVGVSALALVAIAPASAQDRTDIVDFSSVFQQLVPADANGNIKQNVAQLVIDGDGNGIFVAGVAQKIVITPNFGETATFQTIIFEPDTMTRGSGNGSGAKLKQANQVAVFIAHGTGVGADTFTNTLPQLEGCKAKVKALNLNGATGKFETAKTASSCSEAALELLVPDADLRSRIQELFGAPQGGGLQTVSANMPHS